MEGAFERPVSIRVVQVSKAFACTNGASCGITQL